MVAEVVVVGRRLLRWGREVAGEVLRRRMGVGVARGVVRLRLVLGGRVVRMRVGRAVEAAVVRRNLRSRWGLARRLIEGEVEVGLRRVRHREEVVVVAVRPWLASAVVLGCAFLRMVAGRRIE
jgi:hypothetical protein